MGQTTVIAYFGVDRIMEAARQIIGVLFVAFLTIVTSYTQPAGRDGLMNDLEYNVPESPRPRNADKYVRDNGLLLLVRPYVVPCISCRNFVICSI